MNIFLPVSDLIDKIKEFFPAELQEEYIAFARKLEAENVSFHNRIISAQICLNGEADRWPLAFKPFMPGSQDEAALRLHCEKSGRVTEQEAANIVVGNSRNPKRA
jgi:hypothetical protein